MKTDDGYVQMFDEMTGRLTESFIETLSTINSFNAVLTTGTATLRRDKGLYWVAYKKVNGKLRNTYLGSPEKWTLEFLEDAIAKVNQPQEQKRQDKSAIAQIELAGHGKSDKHLQPSLPLIVATTDNQHANVAKIAELQHTVTMQADLIKSLRNDLFNLECESSKREEQVAGYAFMYEEHSNKIFDYYSIIEKWRNLAKGKTKQGHPRFNKLIELLDDIDKIGLSI